MDLVDLGKKRIFAPTGCNCGKMEGFVFLVIVCNMRVNN